MSEINQNKEYLRARRDMVSEGGPVYRQNRSGLQMERAVKIRNDMYAIELERSENLQKFVNEICSTDVSNDEVFTEGRAWYEAEMGKSESFAVGNLPGRLLEIYFGNAFSKVEKAYGVKPVENIDESVYRFKNPEEILNVKVQMRVHKPSKNSYVWADVREYDGLGSLDGNPFLVEIKSYDDLDSKKGIHRAMIPARSLDKMNPIKYNLNPEKLGYVLLLPKGVMREGDELVHVFRERGGIIEELPIELSELREMQDKIVASTIDVGKE